MSRGGGRRVDGEEGGVEGTPFTYSLIDKIDRWPIRGECPESSYSFEIAKVQEGVRGEGTIGPHPRRGDGVWTRSRNLEGMVIGHVIRRKGETRTSKWGGSKTSWKLVHEGVSLRKYS